MYNSLQHSAFEKIGLVLPVDCGHNGELRESQYRMLQEIIYHREGLEITTEDTIKERKESL